MTGAGWGKPSPACSAPVVPIRPLPWWLLRLAALVATLGEEPRTPLLEAVHATLTDLRCI